MGWTSDFVGYTMIYICVLVQYAYSMLHFPNQFVLLVCVREWFVFEFYKCVNEEDLNVKGNTFFTPRRVFTFYIIDDNIGQRTFLLFF